jgi:hypothetical protein
VKKCPDSAVGTVYIHVPNGIQLAGYLSRYL